MRLILVDHARGNRTVKRGGGRKKLALDKVLLFSEEQFDDMIALDEALVNLEQTYPRAARVVELRFFGELSGEEIARVLGVSEQTVKRDWKAARLWLHSVLTTAPPYFSS
jgi:RNA polymerase sigma factor (TIGR02999 family)